MIGSLKQNKNLLYTISCTLFYYLKLRWKMPLCYFCLFFFCQGFLSRTLTTHRTVGDEGTIFYSTVRLPPAHEHSDIYLQLCMWDDYPIFLIALLAFTRLLLDEIYYFLELRFNWLCEVSFCLFTWWSDIRFLLQLFWYGKPMDSNAHRLSPLHYKRTDIHGEVLHWWSLLLNLL